MEDLKMKKTSLNRRDFLKKSAVAASAVALPYYVPSSVLGRSGVSPSNKIVFGFIGTGNQGSGHVGGFTGKSIIQSVAVCDINPEGSNYGGKDLKGRKPSIRRIEKMYADQKGKSTYKGVKGYSDFREFLQHADLDAVCIAVPDHWHALISNAAAKAGLDIFSEKPMARTIYEAREMVKAVRRYGRVFQTGSQQRSDQRFRHACELARNGYLGKIKEVYASVGGTSRPCPYTNAEPIPAGYDYEMWLGPAPKAPYHSKRVCGSYNCSKDAWRAWRDYSAGHITDWGAHHLDISQWGLGMDGSGPVEIKPTGGDSVTYTYANGIPLHKKGGPHQGSVQFIGDRGWVGVSRGKIFASDDRLLKLKMRPNDTKLYASRDHRQDFLNCIRTRKRPICDVEIGCSSVTVCLLGEIALILKRPLKWDPKKWSFVNDPEAQSMVKRPMRSPWIL
jgi:predicted dehydrogenase